MPATHWPGLSSCFWEQLRLLKRECPGPRLERAPPPQEAVPRADRRFLKPEDTEKALNKFILKSSYQQLP